jgi:hypothetical protein
VISLALQSCSTQRIPRTFRVCKARLAFLNHDPNQYGRSTMFRRGTLRLGHQLIREPLPNTEHDTLARARMTTGNVTATIKQEMTLAGAGVVLFLYSLWGGYTTKVPVVTAAGAIN